MSVGIISIFADCKCGKAEDNKLSKFIEPFPPGTEKVPYIRDEVSTTNTHREYTTEKNTDVQENYNTNNDKNVIQVQLGERHESPNTQPQEKPVEAVTINPYDIPDDF